MVHFFLLKSSTLYKGHLPMMKTMTHRFYTSISLVNQGGIFLFLSQIIYMLTPVKLFVCADLVLIT